MNFFANQIVNSAPLKVGDSIGIFAPSSAVEVSEFEKGINILHGLGFKTIIHPQTYSVLNSAAGTGEEKAKALHDLAKNDAVNFIMAASGGNRAFTMLEYLDYDLLRTHKKPVGGFSDVTLLLNALYKYSGITGFHMPTVRSLSRVDDNTQKSLLNMIYSQVWNTKNLKNGEASGVLLGGTCAMLDAMLGTKYQPNFEGAILFLEDVNEELSRLDRMFWNLKNALPFEKLSAIIFGEFIISPDTGRPYGFTFEEIILEHTKNLNIPIVMNAPFGHGTKNIPLALGRTVKMKAESNKTILDYL